MDGFFRALVILFAGVALLLFIFAIVDVVASSTDREEEDREQQNFLRGYFNRKDDNND